MDDQKTNQESGGIMRTAVFGAIGIVLLATSFFFTEVDAMAISGSILIGSALIAAELEKNLRPLN